MNIAILIGNLGDDIKLVKFEDGGCIATFPLATNETYKKKDTGEKVKETTWHNIVMRNSQAEIADKYLVKGDRISVNGKIKNREYTDKSGVKKYITEIIVRDFEFLTTHKSEVPQAKTVKGGVKNTSDIYNDEDDDLPF